MQDFYTTLKVFGISFYRYFQMGMKARTATILNLLGLAVIAFVVIYLTAPILLDARDVDVSLHPRSLPPDGRSQAELTVEFLNELGMTVDAADRKVVFTIVEGHASATLESKTGQMAVLRAGLVPGLVRIQVFVEGFGLPRELVLSVEPQLT